MYDIPLRVHTRCMAPPFKVCTHEQRDQLNHALIAGASVRDVAGRFRVAKSSVDRHKRHCLAPRVANAIARSEELSEERLTAYAYGLLDSAVWRMVRAQQSEEVDAFAHRAYLAEARKCVETLTRLGGIGRADVTVESKSAHVTVLASMSEDELRTLARGVLDDAPRAVVPARCSFHRTTPVGSSRGCRST